MARLLLNDILHTTRAQLESSEAAASASAAASTR
ncbi:hypothetical protein AHiyo8_22090 [Arthrobacter sp. Hiyo8]|nr:hypothetical protein AHiyo8_22090 [Arthrobacter sp. Hiyo8]